MKDFLEELSGFLDLPKNQIILMSLLWFGLDLRRVGYEDEDGGTTVRRLAGELAQKLRVAHAPPVQTPIEEQPTALA